MIGRFLVLSLSKPVTLRAPTSSGEAKSPGPLASLAIFDHKIRDHKNSSDAGDIISRGRDITQGNYDFQGNVRCVGAQPPVNAREEADVRPE